MDKDSRLQLQYVFAGIGGYVLVALWNIRYFFSGLSGIYAPQEKTFLLQNKLVFSLWPTGAFILPLLILFYFAHQSALDASRARRNTFVSAAAAGVVVGLNYALALWLGLFPDDLGANLIFILTIGELIAIPILAIVTHVLVNFLFKQKAK